MGRFQYALRTPEYGQFLTLRSHVVSVDEDEPTAGAVIRQRVPVV
jgi:hypothetical protein